MALSEADRAVSGVLIPARGRAVCSRRTPGQLGARKPRWTVSLARLRGDLLRVGVSGAWRILSLQHLTVGDSPSNSVL